MGSLAFAPGAPSTGAGRFRFRFRFLPSRPRPCRTWRLCRVGATPARAATSAEPLMRLLRHNHNAVASGGCSPEDALRRGRWVKLICGASLEDVAQVRNLALVYTLAGVDCIDCAADPAVVNAVVEGVEVATHLASACAALDWLKPWLMVSINDDRDPHFRKAEFDADRCPVDCPRPCERVCPASAITFGHQREGVITERCYGCGRCLPVCPFSMIRANTYIRGLDTVLELLSSKHVDAVEIHTGEGHLEAFAKLWTSLAGAVQQLKLVAVSVPDLRESMIPSLAAMYMIMQPSLRSLNLWQLDGRPMSGDIGAGATRAAVALAARVASSLDRPPGFLQLAGGTNAYTLEALRKAGFYTDITAAFEREVGIAGVAYGGYARKIVSKYLAEIERGVQSEQDTKKPMPRLRLECHPTLLFEAVKQASALVQPSKSGTWTTVRETDIA